MGNGVHWRGVCLGIGTGALFEAISMIWTHVSTPGLDFRVNVDHSEVALPVWISTFNPNLPLRLFDSLPLPSSSISTSHPCFIYNLPDGRTPPGMSQITRRENPSGYALNHSPENPFGYASTTIDLLFPKCLTALMFRIPDTQFSTNVR